MTLTRTFVPEKFGAAAPHTHAVRVWARGERNEAVRQALIAQGLIREPTSDDLTPQRERTSKPVLKIGSARALKFDGDVEEAERHENLRTNGARGSKKGRV